MTKSEYRNPKEIQRTNDAGASHAPFAARASSFLRASTFGFRHFLPFAACVALAQTPAPPDEDDVPEVEKEWDFSAGRGHDLAMLDKLVPVGQTHRGLRYPVFGEGKNGQPPALETQFESREVTRLDETHLLFRDAVASFFGDERHPDMATRMMSLVEAIYDLQHDFLFSHQPVQILDRDLSVRSGALLHDAVSGITVFSGGVEVYFNEPPPPAAAPAPPSPAPPPPGQ